MKNEILKRAMFAMPLTKDARNSGIMAGFEDEMPEAPEDNVEEMPQMARTPQNPEILMNTLRGDMRSVDARYQELAQMVGEEAAMETPPEVLAMLMGQMGAQQGGIGSLPQGQEMAPPPMAMPPQGGAMPPPPEGMPPPGMEGAGPFPQGGAEQAPPTPDGMPPMRAAVGAFITPATRMAQMAGDKLGQYGSAANAALGRMFMTPQGISQPILENVRGPGGRYTAQQIVTGGEALTAPTFTQGVMQGTAKLADQYPRLASMLAPAAGALGLANAPRGGSSGLGTDLMSQIPTDTIEDRVANSVLNKPPILSMSFDQPFTTTDPSRVNITTGPRPTPAVEAPALAPASAAAQMAAMEPVRPDEFGTLAEVGDEKKSTQDFIKAAVKEKTRGERIKEGYAELAPLFQEILGSDKEDMKTNALLMLADAGFKIASSRQPTAAMALAEGLSGIPKGFMALAAQAKDRELKIKSTALSQAFSDVQEQDKYAQQVKMKVLDGDFRLMLEQIKKSPGTGVVKDGGGGLRIAETKDGSFLGVSIDPKDPTVQNAVQSRFTLRDTDNPYVENRGPAPSSVETDKGERIKLTAQLRAFDNNLKVLENLKGTYAELYSPGTWFQDKVNNLLVPISGGIIRPDVNQAAAAQQIKTSMNSLMRNIAASGDAGRVAVQEQEWARQTAESISDPTAFFQNKELAAKGFVTLEAGMRNARQQLLTQLGYENNDYTMRIPNTGTQNDPFVIPADKDSQRIMFNFLGSTIGKLQDPKATVFVRMPNNTIQQFNPTQLRGLIGNQ